ncbi:SNARE associated Golgi protein-like protein [Ammonifex degensii KC4]|uniref:SNARE associated Golgi protein-like protein n=1 Tax=Ammonifex degensii (strain DSM 10501 / KC4) TaxID=429009 RepID=C9RBG6_AMMDK|nr:DedA family protein [Ammonifex degensii]ACX51593.1 SNARE associated Golgi protein-like protein [Ammonifex degensii KC4]
MGEAILGKLSALGLGGLALGSFLEALGIPLFPGGIMVILAGFLVARGHFPFPAALTATVAGFALGSLIAYLVGRRVGEDFFDVLGHRFRLPLSRLEQARLYLRRFSPGFVLFGRFLPGMGNLVPYLAGMSGISPALFLGLTLVFALAWGTLYLSLGMFFEYGWQQAAQKLQPFLLLAGIAGLFVYWFIFQYRPWRRA